MRESKKVVVGDVTYDIHHFPATQGLKLGIELGKLVAPVVAPLADIESRTVNGDVLKMAADALVKSMGTAETVTLVKELLSVVVAEGHGRIDAIFDAHFSGRLGALPPLLKEVVAHNFRDFFSGVVGLLGQRPTTISA